MKYYCLFAPRGDIDDALGNFSLTLIDSLDMLAVLGKYGKMLDSVGKYQEVWENVEKRGKILEQIYIPTELKGLCLQQKRILILENLN